MNMGVRSTGISRTPDSVFQLPTSGVPLCLTRKLTDFLVFVRGDAPDR